MAENHLLRHLNENMAKFFELPMKSAGVSPASARPAQPTQTDESVDSILTSPPCQVSAKTRRVKPSQE